MNPVPTPACIIPLPFGELTIHTQLQTPTFLATVATLAAPEIMSIVLSGNCLSPSFIEPIPLSSPCPIAGLEIQLDPP